MFTYWLHFFDEFQWHPYLWFSIFILHSTSSSIKFLSFYITNSKYFAQIPNDCTSPWSGESGNRCGCKITFFVCFGVSFLEYILWSYERTTAFWNWHVITFILQILQNVLVVNFARAWLHLPHLTLH